VRFVASDARTEYLWLSYVAIGGVAVLALAGVAILLIRRR
jgi:hypothetical protein